VPSRGYSNAQGESELAVPVRQRRGIQELPRRLGLLGTWGRPIVIILVPRSRFIVVVGAVSRASAGRGWG